MLCLHKKASQKLGSPSSNSGRDPPQYPSSARSENIRRQFLQGAGGKLAEPSDQDPSTPGSPNDVLAQALDHNLNLGKVQGPYISGN
jgi:hypothetical protein